MNLHKNLEKRVFIFPMPIDKDDDSKQLSYNSKSTLLIKAETSFDTWSNMN